MVYFNAVPVPDSSEDERDKQEEDEVAAFLPMLQDYLRRTFFSDSSHDHSCK